MSPEQDDANDMQARFSAFSARTAGISARPGFSDRVMARLQREPASGLLELRLPAWRLLPVGVLAAALALVWAASASSDVNEALAVGYDDVELQW